MNILLTATGEDETGESIICTQRISASSIESLENSILIFHQSLKLGSTEQLKEKQTRMKKVYNIDTSFII